MNRIFISDNKDNSNNLSYIYNCILPSVNLGETKADVRVDDLFASITLDVDKRYTHNIKLSIEDNIADIIAIAYKYSFFKKNIRIDRMSEDDMEILLVALIYADLADDRRYIKGKLQNTEVYSIDGFFNFRLGLLKAKWTEILGYVPTYFTDSCYEDFVRFLILDKCGNRMVTVDNGDVFNESCDKLLRSRLIYDSFSKYSVISEIMLSGAGRIKLYQSDEFTEKRLCNIYGDRVIFMKK